MRNFLRLTAGLTLLCFVYSAKAQYVENFTTTPVGSVPSGWTVAANTDVAIYQRLGACSVNNYGLQTPGVGKTAPMGVVLPKTSYNSTFNDILVQFSIFVFDATLKCSSSKPFDCPTYVKAYIVPATWNDPLGTPTTPSGAPKSTDYYVAQANYQILYPNTSNTIIFANAALPAGVTSYRILLNFKTADGSNCTSGNTKFVLDDFVVSSANCNNCAPTANADYFYADGQSLFGKSTSFSGNVYGGYALWANQAPSGFETTSSTFPPAVNSGQDFDYNNTNLGNAVFALVPNSFVVESSNGCSGTPSPGTLVFNSNGMFTYTKSSFTCVTRVSFYYTLTTYADANHTVSYGTTSNTKVTIDLPGQVVDLPVHFTTFTATRQGKQVLLQWKTAMEQNNKGFYLQRNTGSEWKDIGLVFSNTEDGNSSMEQSYSFKDLNPYNGLTQYRILQVDLDGRGHYSETRAIRGEAAGSKLTLFPNPSSSGNVMVLFDNAGSKEVMVADVAGRVVQQYKNVTSSSLEVKNLQGGFYSIMVHDNNTQTTAMEKVIIKKR